MIKILLLDVDGVLVNGEAFSKHLVRDYGITREITAPFFRGPFIECLVGSADLKQVLPSSLQSWGWKGSIEDFLAYWFRAEHRINEPLMEMVAQFRQQGIRCYLATNQEKYRTAYILENMGFSRAFDGIFPSCQLGCIKPDPAFFSFILRAFPDISAEQILFWDDTPANVEAARNGGVYAEIYQNFADFLAKMPQYL